MGRPVGPMVLFFGCRSPDEDYVYREELEEAQRSLPEGILRIITAFSRQPGQEKIYVQDQVDRNAAEIKKLLHDNAANFYICGRASMSREVGRRVATVLASQGDMSEASAEAFIRGLKSKSKWQEDVWG